MRTTLLPTLLLLAALGGLGCTNRTGRYRGPTYDASSTGAVACTDTCRYASDGACDDGGEGSDYALCELGTDCADCGPRGGGDDGSSTSPPGGLSPSCQGALDEIAAIDTGGAPCLGPCVDDYAACLERDDCADTAACQERFRSCTDRCG